ncbi:biopolymer transporter ExbD [Flammeovirga yaeyamensis]|uniref:Biopolymer transporter ExbD n=1 Tax=Flammeovirga yaeyamensis TaxID=367791 RepID=A0AAX1N965_9BACT|nr:MULTISPECIES: biopolymer transporter ExbD [Flammeovirga]ANQ48706.1 biopolymer transporter ExbD [Flammeovirga sp. MY04]MBB3698787.1 biopolymer transport protein ExbD [Flammeovirga yaeyamensis]NMF37372.1 biopolymer transporter ExbD [Flammeovirga yaeyamensis]QWG03812.1 biopolymer transporter ExbD [Flammeovirga yaeyamensis]
MGLKQENKIDPSFNMSSMTDMIFLLLVFFMLTSNFVTPSGLPISVPSSKTSTKVMPKVSVSITKDLKYYVNEVEVPLNYLEEELKNVLPQKKEGVVVLTVDKEVPVQHLVNVAGIAAGLKAKVSIATKPTSKVGK